VVGCVGLLGAKKRTPLFVEFAARLLTKVPAVRFLVAGRPTAGEEDTLERCRQQAAGLGLADRIEWAGFVADPDAIYRRLDLLVHPGVHEAFGRVLIEAMSWGIPVVGVRSGAVAEIVEDGVTGRVVAPDDAEALATAAAGLLTSAERHAALSAAARSQAQSRFAPPAHVAAVEAVYAGLLD
jgi:glycosyltransferase involved in cell wall biosynthesis